MTNQNADNQAPINLHVKWQQYIPVNAILAYVILQVIGPGIAFDVAINTTDQNLFNL